MKLDEQYIQKIRNTLKCRVLMYLPDLSLYAGLSVDFDEETNVHTIIRITKQALTEEQEEAFSEFETEYYADFAHTATDFDSKFIITRETDIEKYCGNTGWGYKAS